MQFNLIIVSANSGGAFSPIGDVTTIMLWIKGVITTQGVLTEIFVPSLVSMVIPAAILSLSLKGKFDKEQNLPKSEVSHFTSTQRNVIFWLGVGGLVSCWYWACYGLLQRYSTVCRIRLRTTQWPSA